jgi:TolB-like protein/DNA-binding winged helix-turn-helix (wHTH) protein
LKRLKLAVMAIHALGPFRLDTQAHLLLRDSAPVALGRRAIALLRTLVERPGTLVTKDALIEAAWSGRAVEESNLPVQIAALRRVLGEAPGGDRWIETMPGRGYRFIGPVITEAENGVAAAPVRVDAAREPAPTPHAGAERRQVTAKAGHGRAALVAATSQPEPAAPGAAIAIAETVPDDVRLSPLPDKPSIAVLPFQNMSGDLEQEYFVDGMVEEIITALSRIRGLLVIARNSSFTYKSQAIDLKQIGRELGVRYVLEGSVRKAGGRVRITAQLIDAGSRAHLWAERFDGSLEDVFALQDQVAAAVAGVIEPALQAAEMRWAARRPTDDLTAYDLYLRALSSFFSFAKAGILLALDLLEQAIARDCDYGAALALSAACRLHIDINAWALDLASNRHEAIASARRALGVCEGEPSILVHAALVLAYFGEDIEAMLALVERAVTTNPSYARGWYLGGLIRLWAGEPDRAVEDIEKSLRLNPQDRLGSHTFLIGTAHFFSRRFEQAAATLLVAAQEHPDFPSTYRFLAASYAHLGWFRDAKEAVARLRTVTTAVMPTSVEQYRNPDYRELYLSGLQTALAAGQAE